MSLPTKERLPYAKTYFNFETQIKMNLYPLKSHFRPSKYFYYPMIMRNACWVSWKSSSTVHWFHGFSSSRQSVRFKSFWGPSEFCQFYHLWSLIAHNSLSLSLSLALFLIHLSFKHIDHQFIYHLQSLLQYKGGKAWQTVNNATYFCYSSALSLLHMLLKVIIFFFLSIYFVLLQKYFCKFYMFEFTCPFLHSHI